MIAPFFAPQNFILFQAITIITTPINELQDNDGDLLLDNDGALLADNI